MPPAPRAADVQAVRWALAAASAALGTGDVPVGAAVVDPEGRLIAAAANRREIDGDPTAHAEVLALRHAARRRGDGWRLSGCTLAVTLEPCTMCAGALVASRIDRLVYGARDDRAGAVGGLWDVVRDPRLNHHVEVVAGVLDDECGALLSNFFAGRRAGPRHDGKPPPLP